MLKTSDVAREAGVSRATVSYVLNDRRDVRVSEATRRHVIDVAQRLGYSGSPAARALRTGRGDVVLLLLPAWEVAGQGELFLHQLGNLVAQHGLVGLRYEGPHWQGALTRLLARIPAACVVTFDPLNSQDAHALHTAGIPEVAFWQLDHPGQPHTTSITQEGIVETQIDHLLDRGYQRLAYVALEESRGGSFPETRVASFHVICQARGIPDPVSAIVTNDVASVTRTLQSWTTAQSQPLGLAAWNDLTALAITSAAASCGLQVPRDLGVIGGDDAPMAALANPSISSVRFNLTAEAEAIAARVATKLGYQTDLEPSTAAPMTLVPRQSTARSN